jgi:anti-sigma factor ChrR (cupin superfamily)
MGMFYTCEDTSAALSHYLDGILPLGPFLKTRAHLFSCPGCRVLLATVRAMPALAAAALKEADVRTEAQRALDGALARLARGESRPRAEAPPLAACQALAADPDLPMRLMATTHEALNRTRTPPAAPWPLPQDTLDRLPPPEQWRWQEAGDGVRRAALIEDPRKGVRLLLVYAPPNSTLAPHRHLGSESILVLDGGMEDRGQEYGPGAWIHYSAGSCHAPRMAPSGCWCLVREQGAVRFLGPGAWLRHLRHAS